MKKPNFEQLFDELFPCLPHQIPVTVLKLQDTIEDMGFRIADQEDALGVLKDINANLTLRNGELQFKLESSEETRKQRDEAVERGIRSEHTVVKLQEELEIAKKNQDHYLQSLASSNQCVEDAKAAIKKLAIQAQTEKGNAEHLARQAIRLQTENMELIRQRNKLVDEKSDLQKALEKENHALRDVIRNVLMDGLKAITEMSFFSSGKRYRNSARNTLDRAKTLLDNNNIQV